MTVPVVCPTPRRRLDLPWAYWTQFLQLQKSDNLIQPGGIDPKGIPTGSSALDVR